MYPKNTNQGVCKLVNNVCMYHAYMRVAVLTCVPRPNPLPLKEAACKRLPHLAQVHRHPLQEPAVRQEKTEKRTIIRVLTGETVCYYCLCLFLKYESKNISNFHGDLLK